jgi:hypothetical protein
MLLLLGVLAAACSSLRPVPAERPGVEVARYSRFETTFDVPGATRHPDDVSIQARFTAPSGQVLTVGGFASEGRYKVRFTPRETGVYRYTLQADGGAGPVEVASGQFTAVPGTGHGFVRVRPGSPHELAYEDGTPFQPLGENRFNVYDPTWNHERMSAPDYVAYMASHGMNTLRIFIFTDCEREELEPGPQPGCLETQPGRFDEKVAAEYDALFEAAERHGVQVIPTVFAVGFTPKETWKSWEDNPYSTARGGPAEVPDDFFDRPELAERKLRYVLARWGASPSFLAVDLLNEPEWDGGVGEATWIPWAAHLGKVWHAEDPYGHPVMVGSVGLHWNVEGDDRAWYGHPEADLVQWHLYGKETYQVHGLAAELTRKVRETWGYGKPVLLGEFGYGGDDPKTYDHTHVGLWVTTLSGAGVLAHSAPPFTEDSDVLMTPERAKHFRVLADYLARLDRTKPMAPQADPKVSVAGARAWAWGRPDHQALWVMGPKEGYERPVEGATLTLPGLKAGRYRVRWWNDVTGEPLASEELALPEGDATLRVPTFTRHLAGLVEPHE